MISSDKMHPSKKRDVQRERRLLDQLSRLSQDPSLAAKLESQEELQELHDAIGQLKPSYQIIIQLAFIDKLPGPEITKRLNEYKKPNEPDKTENAIRMLRTRAIKELTKQLREPGLSSSPKNLDELRFYLEEIAPKPIVNRVLQRQKEFLLTLLEVLRELWPFLRNRVHMPRMRHKLDVTAIVRALEQESFSSEGLQQILEAVRRRLGADAAESSLTVNEVAERLGLHNSRVRRICTEHDIGTKKGRDRLLSEKDVVAIARLRGRVGRPAKVP